MNPENEYYVHPCLCHDVHRMNDDLGAIYLIEQNLDNLKWQRFSGNPNAISILENNFDRIDWQHLSTDHNAMTIGWGFYE